MMGAGVTEHAQGERMILGEDAFGSERRGDRYLPEFSEVLKRL